MSDTTSEPGSERVYRDLRREILRLVLKPGEDLDESFVSNRFAVSRTPVREALIRLTAEGLVTSARGRGARVAPLSIGDLRAFFEALDILQRSVTRLAASRRQESDLARIETFMLAFEEGARALKTEIVADVNYDFHSAIADAARSSFLAASYRRSLVEGLRIGYVSFSEHEGLGERLETHLAATMQDHREMFEAIAGRDPDTAERLAGRHVELFRNRIAATILSTDLTRRISAVSPLS
ncbi:GntR family transcriptional regulator [Jiella avicenniae]|uniref:GntR family transcriptional regulator n=1 Tax=Jiella avicenniae TaxID=2907202 RepID=A0A9X1P579_9HYPH|nr:GntR family transcriptional regulator [Jiella avicenniae]MCE7030029.1 GntR family transcriptional regulator [Jiella avicenniae]